MTEIFVTRKEWNARSPKSGYTKMSTKPKGVKFHYTGGKVDPNIVNDHALCFKLWRSIQDHHMDGNKWIDIGYTFGVCPHKKAFVGRGLHNLPAANGSGLNSGHYAILFFIGNSGFTKPTDDMKLTALELVDFIRAKTATGAALKGHRDGYNTSCPGEPLYEWIKAGCPKPVIKEKECGN